MVNIWGIECTGRRNNQYNCGYFFLSCNLGILNQYVFFSNENRCDIVLLHRISLNTIYGTVNTNYFSFYNELETKIFCEQCIDLQFKVSHFPLLLSLVKRLVYVVRSSHLNFPIRGFLGIKKLKVSTDPQLPWYP